MFDINILNTSNLLIMIITHPLTTNIQSHIVPTLPSPVEKVVLKCIGNPHYKAGSNTPYMTLVVY